MKKALFFILSVFIINLAVPPPPLPNCGASCYQNAALQSMFAVKEVTNVLKGAGSLYPNAVTCYTGPTAMQRPNVAKGYVELVNQLGTNTFNQTLSQFYNSYVVPLMKCLTGATRAAQQDASEFLGPFIDDLQTSSNPALNDLIKNLFTYSAKSTTQCSPNYNNYSSSRTESGTILSLPITADTLIGNIKTFMAPEALNDFIPSEGGFAAAFKAAHPQQSGESNYNYNQRIDKLLAGRPDAEKCIQTTSLETTPPFFITSLKRFTFWQGRNEKIERAVSAPLKFNVQQIEPTKKSDEYQLIAAICHGGDATGGHYWAYIQDTETERWYRCDDNSIQPAEPSAVESAIATEAYLFIYMSKTQLFKYQQQIIKLMSPALKKKEEERKKQAAAQKEEKGLEDLTKKLDAFTAALEELQELWYPPS